MCALLAQRSWSQSDHDLKYWQDKTVSEPQNALAFFNLGVAYEQESDLDQALNSYEQVIALQSPLSVVALYYEASIFYRRGQWSQSQAILQVIAAQELPPHLKQRVTDLQKKVQEAMAGDQEKTWSVFLDASAGYNSNPQTLSDVTTSHLSADTQTQYKASLDAQLLASPWYEGRINYFFSGSFFQDQGGSNYTYQTLTLPWFLYDDLYRLKVAPEYFTDTYGNRDFSHSYGGTIEVTRKVSPFYLGLSYLYLNIDNVSSSYSYLSGSQQTLSFFYEQKWTSARLYVSVSGNQFNYQDSPSLAASYVSPSFNISFSYFFEPFDIILNAGSELRYYHQAADDLFARQDWRYNCDMQWGYSWNKRARTYLYVGSSTDNSNFNDVINQDSYQQYRAGLGLSWTL